MMRLGIIGAGPGGYVAALKAARLGAHVTIIEDTEVGGTCLNRGCIPTKALLACTEAYSRARELDKFGVDLAGAVTPNLAKMQDRKDRIVQTQVKGIRGLFKSWGIALMEGRGRLISSHTIEATKKDGSVEKIDCDAIIIATGSRPALLPGFPFDGKTVLTSDDTLSMTEIPTSMIIVGAGVIGCEWACIFRELGTEVTMLELMPRAVVTEDEEVSDLLAREFKKKKIKLMTSVKVEKVEFTEAGVRATLGDGKTIDAQKLLVSVGRALNTEGLGLEEQGIARGPRGQITVDDKMQTNVPGVYAVGDVTGGMMLAHVASEQGTVAALNACGHEASMDYASVPAAVFTSPEIASVGLREHQAKERGIKYRTGKVEFRALSKAHAMGEIAGFIKLIAEHDTDKLLGAHIIGPHASDLVHEAALAMRRGLTINDLEQTIHAHPTLSEGMREAAEDVHGRGTHCPKT